MYGTGENGLSSRVPRVLLDSVRVRTAQPGESCWLTVFFFLDLAFVWRFGSLAYALFIPLLVEELLQIEKYIYLSW